MYRIDLINDINTVLSYFENSPSGSMGSLIYKRYYELKGMLQADDLKYNPINGSVRAYLDAFNDWNNPILITMGDLETRIDIIINSKGN